RLRMRRAGGLRCAPSAWRAGKVAPGSGPAALTSVAERSGQRTTADSVTFCSSPTLPGQRVPANTPLPDGVIWNLRVSGQHPAASSVVALKLRQVAQLSGAT